MALHALFEWQNKHPIPFDVLFSILIGVTVVVKLLAPLVLEGVQFFAPALEFSMGGGPVFSVSTASSGTGELT